MSILGRKTRTNVRVAMKKRDQLKNQKWKGEPKGRIKGELNE